MGLEEAELDSKFESIHCLYFQHTHFIPLVGVGEERRTLIGPW